MPEALDFYLDHGRVHVGDLATTTEDAFSAWVSDRAAGLDAIMLAPTRHLVAELNRRARAHRLDHSQAAAEVRLGRREPGQRRRCDHHPQQRPPTPPHRHRLGQERRPVDHHPASASSGDLTVRHNRSQLTVRLPADYVHASTGLGYATTIHAAQGVSADTMHGLLTGQESRQQLYTMLTRGRHANHLYLQVVGDGDPHTVIRPDTISPRTPTETLQQILARDEAPVSASTLLRELNDPAARLFQAVQRYTDGLHVAAEQLVGPQTVAELDQADRYIPGLTTEPAWPTLRAHLLALAAETGEHPLRHLLTAAAVATSTPQATWPPSSTGASQSSRLPTQVRCPGSRAFQQRFMTIPSGATTWQSDPNWSPTSPTRSKTTPTRGDAQPVWAAPGSHPSTALVGDIAVWRAANGINPQDPRPTGGTQLEMLPALWKQRLDRDIARATNPPADARADKPHAGRTALSPRDVRQRPYQQPERRPSGPSAPGR